MVEAAEKTDELEASVKKLVALAEPFAGETGEKLTEEEADKPLTAFLEVDKEVNKAFSALTGFLKARQGEQRVNKEHSASLESMLEHGIRFCKRNRPPQPTHFMHVSSEQFIETQGSWCSFPERLQ